jgi:hypothetical protein
MIYIVLLNILVKLWAYIQRDDDLVMKGARWSGTSLVVVYGGI